MADSRRTLMGRLTTIAFALAVGAGLMATGAAAAYFYIHHRWQQYFEHAMHAGDGPSRKEARVYALPLNNPDMVPASEATHMRDDDPVYGVIYQGQARAYPRWLMIAYHIANDTVNGEPLLLTQCEVCSSATAWVPYTSFPAAEGLAFSTCGFSGGTFEMCDNYTNSRWHPFSGIAHSGFLAGARLKTRVPVVIQRWKAWRAAYPDTVVAFASAHIREREHSHGPQFDIGREFTPDYMKKALRDDARLPPATLIYGFVESKSGIPAAVPLDSRSSRQSWTLSVRGRSVFVVQHGEFTVSAFVIKPENGELKVKSWAPLRVSDARGGLWDAFGQPDASSPLKEPLTLSDGYFAEWYEWASEHPGTRIYDARSKGWL